MPSINSCINNQLYVGNNYLNEVSMLVLFDVSFLNGSNYYKFMQFKDSTFLFGAKEIKPKIKYRRGILVSLSSDS